MRAKSVGGPNSAQGGLITRPHGPVGGGGRSRPARLGAGPWRGAGPRTGAGWALLDRGSWARHGRHTRLRFELLCTKQSEQRPATRHGGAISGEGRCGEAENGRQGP